MMISNDKSEVSKEIANGIKEGLQQQRLIQMERVLWQEEMKREKESLAQQEKEWKLQVEKEKESRTIEEKELLRLKNEVNHMRQSLADGKSPSKEPIDKDGLAKEHASLVKEKAILNKQQEALKQAQDTLSKERDRLLKDREKLMKDREAFEKAAAEWANSASIKDPNWYKDNDKVVKLLQNRLEQKQRQIQEHEQLLIQQMHQQARDGVMSSQWNEVNPRSYLSPIPHGTNPFSEITITLGYLMQLKTSFMRADVEKRARLDSVGVARYCQMAGMQNLSLEKVERLIAQVDTDHKGYINFWEFLGIQVYLVQNLKQQGFPIKTWIKFCCQTPKDRTTSSPIRYQYPKQMINYPAAPPTIIVPSSAAPSPALELPIFRPHSR
eukprot:NODE_2450_length_1577_cov_34.859697_g2108_i0.p1 GENE.NODE_2450_length_1577_cov_34.859697_g2108_i0~~NODE_2450_length_1577_cov_34.859697_g2108_i0.p1  ORF type:complete len:382 (-),score=105.83 NODE_2450_length_1577_cov_34.859697_g2108_i0:182-1327(-)